MDLKEYSLIPRFEIDADVNKEYATVQFVKLFGKEYEDLIKEESSRFILLVVDYGMLGVDVEKSIELARQYGHDGFNILCSLVKEGIIEEIKDQMKSGNEIE